MRDRQSKVKRKREIFRGAMEEEEEEDEKCGDDEGKHRAENRRGEPPPNETDSFLVSRWENFHKFVPA